MKSHGYENYDAVDRESSQALGWASIGIGLAEIMAPKKIEKTMGLGNGQNTGILRVCGVREIMTGIDILTHKDPAPGIWSRVLGDVLDGVLLTLAARKTRRPGGFAAITGAVLGVVAADVLVSGRLCEKKYGS